MSISRLLAEAAGRFSDAQLLLGRRLLGGSSTSTHEQAALLAQGGHLLGCGESVRSVRALCVWA